MIVFHPSIPHCNRALNPLLVCFHRAYNQCTGEFPINTTHSTSVASLTPSPHTLRAQQRLLELIRVCTHIHNIHIHEHVRSLVHLDQKKNNNTNCTNHSDIKMEDQKSQMCCGNDWLHSAVRSLSSRYHNLKRCWKADVMRKHACQLFEHITLCLW